MADEATDDELMKSRYEKTIDKLFSLTPHDVEDETHVEFSRRRTQLLMAFQERQEEMSKVVDNFIRKFRKTPVILATVEPPVEIHDVIVNRVRQGLPCPGLWHNTTQCGETTRVDGLVNCGGYRPVELH